MFSFRMEHNFHAKISSNTGRALWITITVLMGISVLGLLFTSKITFATFYFSRFVLIVCLGIIVHHLGSMISKVRFGLDQMTYFEKANSEKCIDQYSLFN